MRRIQGKKYKMGTYKTTKISLSKQFLMIRFVLNDGTNTLAYFHKDLKTIKDYHK